MFGRVAAIVQGYGLTESFLDMLVVPPELSEASGPSVRFQVEEPPFPLCSHREYLLVQAVLERSRSPYLIWAKTPEDLRWSRPLYLLNPQISTEKLKRFPFSVLYRFYRARRTREEARRA